MKWDYITAAIDVECFLFLSLLTECVGCSASSSYQWLCCSIQLVVCVPMGVCHTWLCCLLRVNDLVEAHGYGFNVSSDVEQFT